MVDDRVARNIPSEHSSFEKWQKLFKCVEDDDLEDFTEKSKVLHNEDLNVEIFPYQTLCATAATYSAKILEFLILNNKVDVNCRSSTTLNETPLFYAASLETAQILLNAGAEPDAWDSNGQTPFTSSVSKGNYETARNYLKLRGVAGLGEVDASGVTPLFVAASQDDDMGELFYQEEFWEDVWELAETKEIAMASIFNSRCGPTGDTVLHAAIARNRVYLIEKLLSHGASIDVTNNSGERPRLNADWMQFIKKIETNERPSLNFTEAVSRIIEEDESSEMEEHDSSPVYIPSKSVVFENDAVETSTPPPVEITEETVIEDEKIIETKETIEINKQTTIIFHEIPPTPPPYEPSEKMIVDTFKDDLTSVPLAEDAKISETESAKIVLKTSSTTSLASVDDDDYGLRSLVQENSSLRKLVEENQLQLNILVGDNNSYQESMAPMLRITLENVPDTDCNNDEFYNSQLETAKGLLSKLRHETAKPPLQT
eukprot:GHVL01000229.1.p1 GENE.GHVL01000229.1~~GHVL01000229.1.p1  ORF type:complete len:486 (-),score=119.36 GHVL01000229.1:1259-2716(-)